MVSSEFSTALLALNTWVHVTSGGQWQGARTSGCNGWMKHLIDERHACIREVALNLPNVLVLLQRLQGQRAEQLLHQGGQQQAGSAPAFHTASHLRH